MSPLLVVERPIHAAGAARERRADGIVIGPSFPTILRAAQSGERDAIETIYRDVAPLVIGYLRANGARDPEDVASDVFVSMVTRFDTFNGDEAHFRSWLLTITYRRLVDEGSEILCVPSAFTFTTGSAHWELLLRARAVENQCWVLAPNQTGPVEHGPLVYGHSSIVDPWGMVVACASDGESVATASIDLSLQADVRRNLPALTHRRIRS